MRLKIKLASALSAAVVATSVLAIGVSAASAAKPLLHPASGTVTCTLSAKAKLSPPLKNDWLHADHQDPLAEPNASVRALPNTTFSANNGAPTAVTTTAKGKGTCTGSFTGPEGTFPVSQVKLESTSTTAGTAEANCAGLIPDPLAPPTEFDSTLKFKLSGATMIPVELTSTLSTLADAGGIGFKLTTEAGEVTGHPAATALVKAYADAITVNAIASIPSTSLAPSTSVCEAQLKFKKGVASLKAPKGLKKITIGGASTITLTF